MKLNCLKVTTHILTDLGKVSDLDIGTNMAAMNIQLVDVKQRDIGIEDMVSIFVEELADIPNAKIKVDLGSHVGGPGAQIQFYLLGQDLDKLEELKNEIMAKLSAV